MNGFHSFYKFELNLQLAFFLLFPAFLQVFKLQNVCYFKLLLRTKFIIF